MGIAVLETLVGEDADVEFEIVLADTAVVFSTLGTQTSSRVVPEFDAVPLLALFLTVGLGYLTGKLRIGRFV